MMFNAKLGLATGILLCGTTLTGLNGCQRGFTIKRATFYTPLGPIVFEDITFGPANTPPAGLDFECSGLDADGNRVSVYNDPATGGQWIRDKDGDYHPVEDGVIDCNALTPTGPTGLGGPTGTHSPENSYIDPSDFNYEADFSFEFDQFADTAEVHFILPADIADHYMPANEMPFLVQENTIPLISGAYGISYSGTVSDVLGAVWRLGFTDIVFTDDIGGEVWLNFSRGMNLVTINTNLGSETIIMNFTNPSYGLGE